MDLYLVQQSVTSFFSTPDIFIIVICLQISVFQPILKSANKKYNKPNKWFSVTQSSCHLSLTVLFMCCLELRIISNICYALVMSLKKCRLKLPILEYHLQGLKRQLVLIFLGVSLNSQYMTIYIRKPWALWLLLTLSKNDRSSLMSAGIVFSSYWYHTCFCPRTVSNWCITSMDGSFLSMVISKYS